MKSRLDSNLIAAAIGAIALVGMVRTAAAQAALDDDDDSTSTTPAREGVTDPSQETHVGVGLRIRDAMVPQGMVQLFVTKASGSSSELGTGLEVVRRKGNFEVQFGLERDPIFIKPGLWIDKGDTLPQDEPDFVEFDKAGYFSGGTFGWYTAEVTFLNHSPITKWLAIRYGGGAGIGLITGKVRRTDYQCAGTNDNPDPCHESTNPADTNTGGNARNPYDIPPVMLVVNAIIGVQLRPVDNIFINVEAGLRTIPFFGTSFGYYF
jgi:hypothetical protein